MKNQNNNKNELYIKASKLRNDLENKKMDKEALIKASKEIDKLIEEYLNEYKK